MDCNQILPIQANYLFIAFCFISDGRPGKEGEGEKKSIDFILLSRCSQQEMERAGVLKR